jgi:hypothetical protein
MKTKHIFTFCLLLSLTGSGILLTDMSSIAQSQQNLKPTISRSTPPSFSPNSEIKSNKSENDSSPIPWIVGGLSSLLHLLEIAGMTWAYLIINQLNERSRDSKSQIKSLTNRLSASEQKQKDQGDQLKMIASEAANARNLTSRINSIEQVAQRKYNDTSYAISSVNTAIPPPSKIETAASIDNSSYLIPKFQGIDVQKPLPLPYQFLDVYRKNPDDFKNQYSPKVVSEDADNLLKRFSGDHQEIILGADRSGNYWLFNEGIAIYLIPSPKLRVRDMNMRTAGSLFDCNNYTPSYQSMTVIRPAIVSHLAIISSQPGANERWKLEQKGILEFI